jgi:hypothetical protein
MAARLATRSFAEDAGRVDGWSVALVCYGLIRGDWIIGLRTVLAWLCPSPFFGVKSATWARGLGANPSYSPRLASKAATPVMEDKPSRVQRCGLRIQPPDRAVVFLRRDPPAWRDSGSARFALSGIRRSSLTTRASNVRCARKVAERCKILDLVKTPLAVCCF